MALGVGEGPVVSVSVGVGLSKTALGCGSVGETYIGVSVMAAFPVGVGVVRPLMPLPTHTTINPSR